MNPIAIAALIVTLLAAGCAARTPRVPEPGDRVRAWMVPEPGGEAAVASIGEVISVATDSLTLQPHEGPPKSMAYWEIRALEIDAARHRTALRVVSCAMIPAGIFAMVTDLVGDDRNGERAAYMGLNTLIFLDGCFFPGPDWRTALVPSRE